MSSFGEAVKQWRKVRGYSQLELGLVADISSRHISFLETGRSKPSREMIIQLSNALDIPLSERNLLFSMAGFAEAYSRMDINEPEMKPVLDALTVMLNNHDPYPAVVLDWEWNIVMANETQQKLSDLVATLQPNFPQSCNLLEVLFDPNGYRPFVENWNEVSQVVIQRIKREQMLHQDRHSSLLERIAEYSGGPADKVEGADQQQTLPMVNIVLNVDGMRLKLFSTLASFGTAIDVTMQELVIEQYFPADDSTKRFFEGLA